MPVTKLATLKELEEYLISTLAAALVEYKVRVVGEPSPDYLATPQGDRILIVAWDGDSSPRAQTINGRLPVERRFRLLLKCRGLAVHQEGYELVDAILQTLAVRTDAPESQACIPTSASMVGFATSGGVYTYEFTVQFDSFISRRLP